MCAISHDAAFLTEQYTVNYSHLSQKNSSCSRLVLEAGSLPRSDIVTLFCKVGQPYERL